MKGRNSETPNGSRGLGPWLSLFCGAALLLTGVLIGWTLAPAGGPSRLKPSGEERFNRTDGLIPVADLNASDSQDEDSEGVEIDEAESENEEAEPSVEDAEDAAVQAWNDTVDAVVAAQDAGKRPSAESVAAFKAVFDALTDEQKTEHLQEALNLFADESVGFLSAILLDPKESADVLQSVLGDVATRPTEVRDAVLRKLAAERDHPLANDARLMLEGTGFHRRRARHPAPQD